MEEFTREYFYYQGNNFKHDKKKRAYYMWRTDTGIRHRIKKTLYDEYYKFYKEDFKAKKRLNKN